MKRPTDRHYYYCFLSWQSRKVGPEATEKTVDNSTLPNCVGPVGGFELLKV